MASGRALAPVVGAGLGVLALIATLQCTEIFAAYAMNQAGIEGGPGGDVAWPWLVWFWIIPVYGLSIILAVFGALSGTRARFFLVVAAIGLALFVQISTGTYIGHVKRHGVDLEIGSGVAPQYIEWTRQNRIDFFNAYLAWAPWLNAIISMGFLALIYVTTWACARIGEPRVNDPAN